MLGLVLLVAGALGVYLFISPGTLNPSHNTADGGATAADASAH